MQCLNEEGKIKHINGSPILEELIKRPSKLVVWLWVLFAQRVNFLL